jgi:hypothetical protein
MENKARFLDICAGIKRAGIDELVAWLEKSDFFTAPASTRYHGNHDGGLLEHSLNVYDELERIIPVYPQLESTKEDSIRIVSLFHDLCKVGMYQTEKRNRKNSEGQWESYDYYSINEKFCFGGHGSKSMYIVQSFMKLTPAEAVSINCHMGIGDGNSYVGNAFEQYPLAWALHVADEAATFLLESE